MKVMFCDRCGKEIAENEPHCIVVMQQMVLSGGESRCDLCRACSTKLQELIGRGNKPPPPPRPRIDKPPAVESRGL